jgi:hypothetical protein
MSHVENIFKTIERENKASLQKTQCLIFFRRLSALKHLIALLDVFFRLARGAQKQQTTNKGSRLRAVSLNVYEQTW